MAYCIKCGKENPDTAKFCTGCGTTLDIKLFTETGKTGMARPSGKKTWMAIAIAALAGLCIVGYFLFFQKTQEKDSATQNNKEYNQSTGKYPYTSERLLTDDDVRNISQADLRIMRNEIYARHGLIFQSADMKNYFSAQSWYTPKFDNVIDMLSAIEKNNIALIKRYEGFEKEYSGDFRR